VTVDQSFGQWLKQRRSMRDMTQQMLADQAGCTVYAIRKLEANRSATMCACSR
jgi:transcriptional regulator with XRE-family HTH domain